jgi:hypothetical protein
LSKQLTNEFLAVVLLQMVHVKGKGEMETYFLQARHGDGTKFYQAK